MAWKPKSARVVDGAGGGGGWKPKSARAVDAPDRDALDVEGLESEAAQGVTDRTRAALHGYTGGLVDEALGAAHAAYPQLDRPISEIIDRAMYPKEYMADPLKNKDLSYTQARDEARAVYEPAVKAHPGFEAAGAFAMPVPGGAAAKDATLLARLLRGGAQGASVSALTAAGNTKADLTKGQFGDFLGDVGTAGLFGGGVGATFGGLGYGASQVADWAKGRSAKAAHDAADMAAKKVEEGLAKKMGEYRSAKQSGNRIIENVLREAEGLPEGHPLKIRAKQFLEGPKGMKIRESILERNLDDAPSRLTEMEKLLEEHQALVGSKQGDISTKVDDLLTDPMKKQLVPRLRKYFSRTVPVAVAAGLGGGIPGMAAGAASAATLGDPGTAAANFARHPGVRKSFADLLQKTAGSENKLGKWGSAATDFAERAAEMSVGKAAARDAPRLSDEELLELVRHLRDAP